MPNPALVIGGSVISGAIGAVGASKAASAQSTAINNSQQILAESNVEAARLVAAGQHEAAAAILAAGEKAAAATLEAARLGREQIERFFQIAKADIAEKLEMSRDDIAAGVTSAKEVLSPYNKQGLIAGRELASMLGIADDQGQTRAFNAQDLEATPQYQFQFDQGMKAIDRGSRSKLSGGQLKDLQAYGNGLASNVYNERIQQLLGLNSMGLQAASGMASADIAGAGMLSSVNTSASGQLAQSAGGAGSQNAQIAQNTGNSLSNIALSTGNSLANNATAGANALAGLQQQYGSDMSSLALGRGAAQANKYTGQANAWSNALGMGMMGYGMFGGNPLQTSKSPSYNYRSNDGTNYFDY